jgi:hypothetical protein
MMGTAWTLDGFDRVGRRNRRCNVFHAAIANGQIALKNRRDHLEFEPIELIGRLASVVPGPGPGECGPGPPGRRHVDRARSKNVWPRLVSLIVADHTLDAMVAKRRRPLQPSRSALGGTRCKMKPSTSSPPWSRSGTTRMTPIFECRS